MPLAELNLLGNKKITDEEIKELKEKGCVIIKTNQWIRIKVKKKNDEIIKELKQKRKNLNKEFKKLKKK